MATVNDMIFGNNLVPGVLPKLNNRSDIVQNVPRWIVSAIRYITDTYPFEELSVSGIPVNLTFNQEIYPIGTFADILNSPNQQITRFDSFILYLTTSLTGFNDASIELKWRSIKVVRQLSGIIGMPVMYTIYGNQQILAGQQVILAMKPNREWLVRASYQVKHPFVDGISDPVLLPDAWLEVVACTAALIGAEENRMTDNIQMLRAVLYGDPENPAKPGLIHALVSSRSQFSNVNERMLNMVSEL